MIKRTLILLVVFASGFIHLNAQVKFGFSKGIKMNVTASNLLLKNADSKSSSGIGLSFGNSDKLEINENFALQGEFMLHYRTSVLSNNADGVKNRFNYWGAEVPVYVMGQGKTSSGKFFVGIGSYVDFGFNAENAGINLYRKDKITGKSFMKRWDYGCGIIGGYVLYISSSLTF